MHVSIILPCYNPPPKWAENIIVNYNKLKQTIADPIEVILVQDGNAAGVSEADIQLLKTLPAFKYIHYDVNRGKGYAIREGVKQSTGDIVIYTDVDFPYTIESVKKIYTSLASGECEIAVGIKNKDYYAHVPMSRQLVSKALRKMIRFFLSIPITDTQCGLKGFVKSVKPLFLSTTIDRYLFDLEFIRKSYKKKRALKTIPIDLHEHVQFRVMNYRILLPEMVNFLQLLFKNEQ